EKIIKEIDDKRVSYLKIGEANRSIARNVGLRKACGKYVQFLDADDELEEGKIQLSCDFLDRKPNYFAYMTLIEYQTLNGEHIKTAKKLEKNLTAHNTIPMNAIVMRNNEIIEFDSKIVRCEDWLFWVENLIHKGIFFNRDYIGGYVNISGENTMRNRQEMLVNEIKVRNMISCKFPVESRTLFNFKYNLFGFVQLISLQQKNSSVICLIKENKRMIFIARLFLKLPIISKMLVTKINSINDGYPYKNLKKIKSETSEKIGRAS